MEVLVGRGVVQVSGPDALSFLNGLLTNDVAKAGQSSAIYAAMLTPQGKYLFDLFVVCLENGNYLLDVSRPEDFVKRLGMYKLRANVAIENLSEGPKVCVSAQPIILETAIAGFEDPRSKDLGWRYFASSSWRQNHTEYEQRRLGLGIPDAARDLLLEKDFIMEGLFDELGGLDHNKGCYVGQEMTSRMKRRTQVKNKLCRIRYEGAAPDFETPIVADGWEVGRMRSGIDGVGIAMIRFDRARKAQQGGHILLAGDKSIALDPPKWLIEPTFD